MIKFRGHHLICLNYYEGKGYNEEYVANLSNLVQLANSGEKVKVVEGGDDVCSCCPYLIDNNCEHKPESESSIKTLDKMALSALKLKIGDEVYWANINKAVSKFEKEFFVKFCNGCDWIELCKSAQENNFN